MRRSRVLGVGAGFSNPLDPLSPGHWVSTPVLPKLLIPCVHTQADSQQQQEEQQHGATALYNDGWDNSSQLRVERCRLWVSYNSPSSHPSQASPAPPAVRPQHCQLFQDGQNARLRLPGLGRGQRGPICSSRDSPASIPTL